MDIEQYVSFHKKSLNDYRAKQEEINKKAYNSIPKIVNVLER